MLKMKNMNHHQHQYSCTLFAGFAGIALFLSSLALLGHAIDLPILTSLLDGQQQMVISTAFGILLASVALITYHLTEQASARLFLKVIAFLLIAIGTIALLEFKLDIDWLDFNALHRNSFKINPGRMAFMTAICFVLLGFAMLSISLGELGKISYLTRICLISLGLLTSFSLLSFMANFEFLSSFGRNNRMAFPTALSFLALALALKNKQQAEKQLKQEVSEGKLYSTLELLLVLIVMAVALLSFAASQQRIETLMANQLEKEGSQSRDYFSSVLSLRHNAAILHADKTEYTEVLDKYRRNANLNLSGYLTEVSGLHADLSMLALENPEHQIIYQKGQTVPAQLTIQIFSNPKSQLLWNDGYYLRTTVPKYDNNGDLLGFVVLVQRMEEITRFHSNAISKAGTSDLVLCGLDGAYQVCFPFRWSSKADKFYGYLDGKALPVTRAVIGFTETTITTDYRRERVMVALGPVGETGLGMAVKIDMHELYEPIRNQFYLSMPFFIFLTLLSLLLMRIKLKPLIDEIEQSRRRLGRLALQDPLTGLANRALFHDRLELAISKLARSNKKIGLIYLDVDYFKIINDTYGHIAGDEVLVWFAKQLKESVRQSDTVARIGGDEFSIIIEDLQETSDAANIAAQILERLHQSLPTLSNGPVNRVTASLGVAVTANKAIQIDRLIRDADQALYRAKQKGRNTFELIEVD